MPADFTWKQFQFITTVQTAIINNATNLARQHPNENFSHIISGTAAMMFMDDAFFAAERIPANLDAREAAAEFLGFILPNLREEDEECPAWFRRW